MKSVPPSLADQAWKIAGRVTWTVEDWADFYHSLTQVFIRIAARHAKAKLEQPCPAERRRP